MATTWKAPTWRMPNEKNQSKFESYSLDFNGSDEYINCGTPSTFAFGTDDFSISGWVYLNTSSGYQWLFSTGTNFAFGFDSSRNLQLWVGGAATTPTFNINLTQWHHVVAKRESGTVTFYIDGVAHGTTYSRTNSISAGAYNYIGTFNIAQNHIDGSISDLTFFDYAISSDQVSSLYNSGSPINPMTLKPAPIAYYPLGGNASTGGDPLTATTPNTLSVPNVAVPDASVFDFPAAGSDLINCGNKVDFTNAFTLSSWVKTDTTAASYIFYKNATFTVGKDTWYDGGVGNRARVTLTDSNGLSKDFRSNVAPTGATVTVGTVVDLKDGNWHQIVFTYDGVNQGKLYTDGALTYTYDITDGAWAGSLASNTNDLILGSNVTVQTWTGEMSNIQAWESVLTGAEITTLYNSGVPLLTGTQPQEANLKAWYKLNQTANWEADTAGNWQIPDAVSSYPQSFDFGEANAGGEYIDAPTNIGGFTKCSTSVWLNPSSVSARSTIFATNTANNFTAYFWTGNIIYVTVDGAYGYLAAINNYIDANKWNHLSIVYDGTFTDPDAATQNAGRLKMYVNGSYIAFQAISGTIPSSIPVSGSDNIRIGTTSPTTYEFGGELSNFTIYDTNLSSSQVETLYNNGSPLTTAIASDNLKAWYKLNDNEKFDGTNWSVENQKYPASFDSCLDFNGTSSSVNVPAFSDYDNGDLSACIWVNTSDTRTNTDYVFSNSGSSTKAGFDIAINRYGSVKTMRKTRTLTADTGFNVVGLTENTWHHIAFTYEESTNTIKQYFDGQLTETVIGGTRTKAASLQLTIGSYQDTGSFFLGKLSNAAIYNTVLDPATITAIYNNGTPETSISGSPVAWWKLDNLTTGIQDSVGSRNGTNSGATKVNTFVSTEAATSSGMTEQNLVNNNVSALNGESSGMDTSNLVTSTLTRQIPYNNYSMYFDGTGDELNFSSNTFGAGLSNFSVSAWVKLDGTDTSYECIVAVDGPASNRVWQLFEWSTNRGWAFQLFNDSGTGVYTPVNIAAASSDVWYHVVGTYDGSNIKLYVDGVLKSTVAQTGIMQSSTTNNLKIGNNGYNEYFKGNISNVSLYDKTLTSTEVLKLYNSGVPGDLSNFNPQPNHWWSLGSDSYFDGSNWVCPDLISTLNNTTSNGLSSNSLEGNAPNSTANGTSTNMAIDANLTGSAPNSSNNSFSVNMGETDRTTGISTVSITAAGTGYIASDFVSTTGGSGSGCVVNINGVNGAGGVVNMSIYQGGSGYVVGDVLTISGGGGNATITVTSLSVPG